MNNIYPSILFSFVLVGYPIAAGITSYFSIDENIVSIIYRLIVLVSAILMVVFSYLIERPKINYKILIGVTFVLFYSLRMLLEWILYPIRSKIAWDDFWIFLFFVCIIPALPFIWKRNLPDENLTINALMMLGVLGLTLNFYSILQIKMTSVDDLLFGGRLESERLNPIAYGHLAVTTTLIGLWTIITKRKFNIISVMASFIGILGIAASGSRGPVFSFFVCLVLLLLYLKIRLISWCILFVLIFVTLLGVIQYSGGLDNIYLSGRVGDSMFEDQGRSEIYIDSLNYFIDNFFVGAGYPLDTYPHNIIIEAFMSSGVIGGLLITVTLIIGLVASIGNIREKKYSWIGLIFIQYLLFSMVSNSIYYSNILWMIWVCVIVSSGINNNSIFMRKVSFKLGGVVNKK